MREAGETWPLTKKFQELLFRHQGEFTHPELYQVARAGTLHVVTDFLDEIEACLHYLIALEVDDVGDDYKLAQLKRVGRVYGRPALLLSGGALARAVPLRRHQDAVRAGPAAAHHLRLEHGLDHGRLDLLPHRR